MELLFQCSVRMKANIAMSFFEGILREVITAACCTYGNYCVWLILIPFTFVSFRFGKLDSWKCWGNIGHTDTGNNSWCNFIFPFFLRFPWIFHFNVWNIIEPFNIIKGEHPSSFPAIVIQHLTNCPALIDFFDYSYNITFLKCKIIWSFAVKVV